MAKPLLDIAKEDRTVYWAGLNGFEYFAIIGHHQIYGYDCENYPNPPDDIIQYHKRIESKEEFYDALINGKYFTAIYKEDNE